MLSILLTRKDQRAQSVTVKVFAVITILVIVIAFLDMLTPSPLSDFEDLFGHVKSLEGRISMKRLPSHKGFCVKQSERKEDVICGFSEGYIGCCLCW